jgi:hypothetical protein
MNRSDMRPHRIALLVLVALALVAGASPTPLVARVPDIPARLSDQEFWRLTEDLSEPDGTFRSDNLLSNEMVFARLLPEVLAATKPGGVYMGVGPEQNFTYITAMKSKIAFITDIRRNNLHLLLMYKAVFELSNDRADFISRLFTKPRPAGLSATAPVTDIMDAFWSVTTGDEAAYAANLEAIQRHLTKTHAFPLPAADIQGVAQAYRAFYVYGPSMNYSASLSLTSQSAGNAATYRDLMTQTDANGQFLTFLGSDEKFRYMKDMEARNMIVPVVGNFSGPKAIRAIGAYVRSRGATVSAFYVSTVEPYLKRDGSFPTFCGNVATLPMDDASVFIRPGNVGNLQSSGFVVPQSGAATPRIGTYQVGVVVPMKTGCS